MGMRWRCSLGLSTGWDWAKIQFELLLKVVMRAIREEDVLERYGNTYEDVRVVYGV